MIRRSVCLVTNRFTILFDKEKVFVRTLASIAGVSLEKSLQHAAAKEKTRFEGELLAARNIQKLLIPANHAVFPQAVIHCHYRPAHEVSGDYLDYFINDLGHLVIAIGDVCGKGVPAALLMNVIREYGRRFKYNLYFKTCHEKLE